MKRMKGKSFLATVLVVFWPRARLDKVSAAAPAREAAEHLEQRPQSVAAEMSRQPLGLRR